MGDVLRTERRGVRLSHHVTALESSAAYHGREVPGFPRWAWGRLTVPYLYTIGFCSPLGFLASCVMGSSRRF